MVSMNRSEKGTKKKKKIRLILKKKDEIKTCAICQKRLGLYENEAGESVWVMECTIDNYLDKQFKSYDCCGNCCLDRIAQKTFEKKRRRY